MTKRSRVITGISICLLALLLRLAAAGYWQQSLPASQNAGLTQVDSPHSWPERPNSPESEDNEADRPASATTTADSALDSIPPGIPPGKPIYSTEQLFRLGDSHSYWTLAERIASGEPYQYGGPDASIFRTPLYPIVLAPFTLIPNPLNAVWWARVLGCLLGTGAVGLVMLLARAVAPPGKSEYATLAAGLLAAIYPGAIGMSIMILSESLFCPLMLLHLWLWQRAWRAGSGCLGSNGREQEWELASKEARSDCEPQFETKIATKSGLSKLEPPHFNATFNATLAWYSLLSGFVAGLAVLARPSWLLFLPFLFFFGIVLGPARKRHATIFALSLIGLTLTMSPWWIRNASLTNRFVPTTLQVGLSMYDGWHPGATGASDEGMRFKNEIARQQRQADLAHEQAPNSTFEYRVNQRAQRAALRWAWENPSEVLRLALVKFTRTWSLWPKGGQLASVPVKIALSIGCIAILLLAFAATPTCLQHFGWKAALLWMPSIYFTLLHMVFVGSIRYREPALLVLCSVSGLALGRLITLVVGGSRDTPPGGFPAEPT